MIALEPRCGDTVLHRPSGETWRVAWADAETDDLMYAGWPEGMARLSECDLTTRCTDAEHKAAVDEWRNSSKESLRRNYVLAKYDA